MKIAMVCIGDAADVPGLGPPADRAVALSSALTVQGHDVVIYQRRGAPAPERSPDMTQVRVVRLVAGPPVELSEEQVTPYVGTFAWQLRYALRRQRPEVIHTHGWLAGLAALLTAGPERHSVVHTFHRPLSASGPQPSRRTSPQMSVNRRGVERAITRRAAHLIAASTQEQRCLIRLGAPTNQVSIVPPGVDCDQFDPRGITQPCQQRFRLVAFGSPGHPENRDTISALSALPDTELVIMPDPDEWTWAPDTTQAAHRHAERLAVADRLRVVPTRDPSRRAAVLRGAHAALCQSTSPLGAAPLEAMACAVPVITTTAADPLEAVIDNITGLHIDHPDPTTLARVVRELITDTTRQQCLGIAARDRAANRYSWSHIATETRRVYNQLTSLNKTDGKLDTQFS